MKKIIIILLLLFVGAYCNAPLQAQNGKIENVTLQITGKNIAAKVLAETIRDYLVRMNLLNDDSEVAVKGLPDFFKPNSSAEALVEDEAAGKKINVKLTNYDFPDVEPSFLMFSNHPEKVSSYGALFNAACVFKKKIRFQFYHLSSMVKNDPYLSLRFFNPDEKKPAVLYVLGDMQGPSENYMKMGHQNNINFLNNKNNKFGIIYTIKPKGDLVLFNEQMPKNKLFCGIYEMYLVSGGPVWFYLFSCKSKKEKPSYTALSSANDTHARGVYMVSDFNYDVKFITSEKEKYIIFGDTPLRNIFPQRALAGDYGAIYNFNIYIQETGGKASKVDIIFQPRGGAATGTFILDDRLIEAGTTKVKQEKKIWSYRLNPYERRLVRLRTLPEGASYYPVRIIFKSEKLNYGLPDKN